jgi:hypothetical protein
MPVITLHVDPAPDDLAVALEAWVAAENDMKSSLEAAHVDQEWASASAATVRQRHHEGDEGDEGQSYHEGDEGVKDKGNR